MPRTQGKLRFRLLERAIEVRRIPLLTAYLLTGPTGPGNQFDFPTDRGPSSMLPKGANYEKSVDTIGEPSFAGRSRPDRNLIASDYVRTASRMHRRLMSEVFLDLGAVQSH